VCQPDDRWHNYAVRMYLDKRIRDLRREHVLRIRERTGMLVRTDVLRRTEVRGLPIGICFASDVTIRAANAHYGAMGVRSCDADPGLATTGRSSAPIGALGRGRDGIAGHAPRASRSSFPTWARVALGDIPNVDDGAVRMQGLHWSMAFPPDG
jgi:hypothetical protein